MNAKRIIPCLDVKDGRVVKGTKFLGLNDVASPIELGKLYCDNGADELVFYDITASAEGRKLFGSVLRQVVAAISVPLAVGGGISRIEDFDTAMDYGAAKVSINTGALKDPALIEAAAKKYGSGRVVLSVDVKQVDGKYKVFTNGGMSDTGLDALEWIKRGEDMGAGELVVNSIETDGVRGGFDLPMLGAVCDTVKIPVVASGGAGSIEDFIKLFKEVPQVSAGLGASVFHFGIINIRELKAALNENDIAVNG